MISNYRTHFHIRNISLVLLISLIFSFYLPKTSIVSAQVVDTETPTQTITETPTDTFTELPSETPTSTNTKDPFATSTPTATMTPLPVDPGTYDDKYFQIRYDGWIFHALTGAFQNGEHYSSTPGSTAVLSFYGTGVTFLFRRFSTMGTIRINIDGVAVVDLDQFSETDMRNQTWLSEPLVLGSHTITFTHIDGLYVNLDALIISGPPTPTPTLTNTPTATKTRTATVTATASKTPIPSYTLSPTQVPAPMDPGLVDDLSGQFGYEGWFYHKVTGLISNSEHFSNKLGGKVNFRFNGNGLSIHYRKYPTFGTLNVYIDGGLTASINQTAPVEQRGQMWTSPLLAFGMHTVMLEHLSNSYAVMDAVTVYGPPTATPTPTITNTPSRTFTPSKTPTITLTVTPSRTPTNTKTPTPSYTSTVTSVPIVINPGLVDDADYRLQYSGWVQQTVKGMQNNTEHYSKKIGNTLYSSFNGTGIIVHFRKYSTFGLLNVKIDGVSVADIDQFEAREVRGQYWESDILAPGIHILELTHSSGTYTVLDAIQVDGPATVTPTASSTPIPSSTKTSTSTRPPTNTFTPSSTSLPTNTPTITKTPTATPTPAILGLGIVDDMNSNLHYFGWQSHPVSGMFSGTEHYSPKIGDQVMFNFSGEMLSLQFRTYMTFGILTVNIDGLNYIINQQSGAEYKGIIWTSPALSPGFHTVLLTHSTGTYVSLDAVTISGIPTQTPTPSETFTPTYTFTPSSTLSPTETLTPSITPTPTVTPEPSTAGKYDDSNPVINYNGWIGHSLTGMFMDTEHYSQKLNNTASMIFNGTGFSIFFRRAATFGVIELLVDNVSVGTVNEYSASEIRGQSWVSGDFAPGDHTLTLRHMSGTTIVLDAILIR
jgi:hypothetical protein